MKRITIDILFLLLVATHLIGQVFLLGDFSGDDLALNVSCFENVKDSVLHHKYIQGMKRIIKEGDKHSFRGIINFQRAYPPLFHYSIAILAFFSFDKEYYVIRCGVLLFSVLIFFLLYGYFREKKDPLIGIWAVSLTACSPFFLKYSTAITPHMFMGLCVLFLFVLSERTDNFRNRGWSIFFGIMSGLCLFAKNEVLIYCFALYCILAISVILKPTQRQIKNLVLSLCFFGNFFVYFFYLYIYYDIIESQLTYKLSQCTPEVVGSSALLSLASFTFYGRKLFETLIGPCIAGIACVAFIVHFIKPCLYKERNIIFFCIIAIIIFTAIPIKWPEYISPLVPIIAIICARGISSIRFHIVQSSILVILACYLTVSAYAGPLLSDRICTRDITQFEYAKIWDMVEEYIARDAPTPIEIQVLGAYESSFVYNYLNLRAVQKGYNVDGGNCSREAYPLDIINHFFAIPLCIYISDSEEKKWPTKVELWDEFKRRVKPKEENITLQDFGKVVETKNSFNEVARIQVTLHSRKLYVFLYENQGRK